METDNTTQSDTPNHTLVVHGITTTAFLLSDWMRHIGVPDKDIENGLMKVSKHFTQDIPAYVGLDAGQPMSELLQDIKNDITSLIESMNDQPSMFTRDREGEG